jgi:peptidoglycan/LPS O-acetylase OafA/YrhL
MVALAGEESTFGWAGTFVAVLLPGAVTGGLLGWAEHLRRTGGRRHWRWLALSPLALATAPLLLPGAVVALLTQGLGGGAIAFALTGMAGGFALSRRGSRWARLACGLLTLVIVAGVVLSTPGVGGDELALTTPRGAWAGLLGGVSVLTLAVASSIPHRPVAGPPRERAEA